MFKSNERMFLYRLVPFVVLVALCPVTADNVPIVSSYSQVHTVGSDDTAANSGPKIYKALNMDLIFPPTFNSSASATSVSANDERPSTEATPNEYMISQLSPQNQQQQHQTHSQPMATIFVTPAPFSNAYETNEETALADNQEQISQPQLQHQRQQQPQHNYHHHQQQEQRQQQDQFESSNTRTQDDQISSTGRAVDYRPPITSYPLGQFISPLIRDSPYSSATNHNYRNNNNNNYKQRPSYDGTGPSGGRRPRPQSGIGKIIYPPTSQQHHRQPAGIYQHRQRPPGREDEIMDRFTPGEAVASAQFLKNVNSHRKPKPNHSGKASVAASSNVVQSYVPPKDLYSFPPNLNAKYPSPSQDPKAAVPSNSVNSYVPPPSGTLANDAGYPLVAAASDSGDGGYKYKGPLISSYLPPKDEDKPKGDSDDGDESIGVLPASAMDAGGGGDDPKGSDDMAMDDMKDMTMDTGDHDHHHDHDHDYDPNKEYPTPPPGWLEEHPEAAHDHPQDHDHDHHFDFHDHFPTYPHYSDIIYDDHHHHHAPIELPTTPAPPVTVPPPLPPPEPPQEPRVKKYSYFYIGRKLWYIPLYFTVWFSFYVLWLILKSIARHKVNLPNHYVNPPQYVNRRSLRSVDHPTDDYINELTASVLQKIDDFKKKFDTS